MDGILLTSPDGQILDASPSARAILGRTREQIIAAGREGLIDAADPNLPRLIEERQRTGRAHGVLTARRADGSRFPMEIFSMVFLDSDGNQRTCIIFRDVSLRRKAENERERLIAELRDALSNGVRRELLKDFSMPDPKAYKPPCTRAVPIPAKIPSPISAANTRADVLHYMVRPTISMG